MPRSLRHSLCLLATAITPALAQQPAPPAAAPAPAEQPAPAPAKTLLDRLDLKDGDTLVFLGDSITHQCLYTQYVEDYYYTRYPKLHLHFHNSGVGGDRAQDALDRFEADVASFKPKYVTILLGMNDGGYTRYEQAIFDTYQRGMTTLLDKIAEIGATAVPMTPTMFDSLPSRLGKKPNIIKETYYNGVLSLYGSWLREQAGLRGLGFVDMWGPMNDITLEQRKKDAQWTFLPDSVHPAPTGQVIMAEALVHDLVPHTPLSQITVESKGGQPGISVARGIAGNLKQEHDHLSFDFTAESLPWVLPPEAVEGYKLVHAGHHDSNEKVSVRELPAGRYDLKIDDQTVGTYAAGQLAFGVELEENEKTPQYQQALKVALLNKQRNDEAVRPLRDLWRKIKIARHNVATAQANNAPNLAELQAGFDKTVAEMQPQIEGTIAKARQFEEAIYQANQPVPHHYELSIAAPVAPPVKK